MQALLKISLLFISLLVASEVNKAEQQAKMDEQMKALQQFLFEAEKEGKADKPMMIKHVDGKMVMEAIPDDILANFVFPDQLDKEDI